MRTRAKNTPWVLSTSLLTACAASGDTFRAGSVLRSVDNDFLDRSDDQYTSGLSLSYISRYQPSFADTALPDGIAELLDEGWPFAAEEGRFVVYSLSHRVFTPTDLNAVEVVEDDLPYSALLYGTATVGSQGPDVLNAFSVSAGIVGPLALGEPLQSGLHRLIGSVEPEGWDNQLDNEPLLNIGVEHRRRLLRVGRQDGFGADLLGSASATAGNLQTQATLAATARVGYRVPSNLHMLSHFLAEESLGLRAFEPPSGRPAIYLFGGLAATALAGAIYLDGNTFSDSHRIDHDHHVLRGSLGVAARRGRLLLSLAFERATLPWDHPDGLDEESFLRLGISWDF